MDEAGLKVHLKMKKHQEWEDRHGEEHQRQSRLEEVAIEGTGTGRDSGLSEKDKAFHMKYIQVLLANGIMRKFVQEI
jgi:hypothetical protein